VSNNRHRPLKTNAAQRLLPAPWRQELVGWRSQRHHEGGVGGREQLLFSALAKPSQPLPEDSLITPVRDALRAVTDDDSLVFHHLRHSCASWSMLRLLAPALPWTQWQRRIAALDHPWFAPPACAALRRAILGVRDEAQPVRHLGYALARLLGHQRVATTLRSYIHLTGLMILGLQTRDGVLALGAAEVRALLGLNPTGAGEAAAYQRWRRLWRHAWSDQRGGLDPQPILQAARGHGPYAGADWPTTPAASARDPRIGPPAVRDTPLRLEQLPALLNALFQPDQLIEQIARNFAIAPRLVQRVKEAAHALAAQRTRSGNRRFTMPPQPPARRSDGDALATVVKWLDTEEAVDWPTITAGIRLLDRCDPSRGHRILMQDDDDARRFQALLVALGLPPGRLRADLYPQAGAEAENRRHWCRCLGLPAAAINLKSPVRSPGAPHGAIALGVTSRRAFSRLRPGMDPDSVYDPARAQRALAGFDTRGQDDALCWQLADAGELADLVWLLGWFGIPSAAITLEPERYRLAVVCSPPVAGETGRRARRLLAQAKPFHNLHIVSPDPADIHAVITVLLAGGVACALLNVDFRGRWEPAVLDALTQDLERNFGLARHQLTRTHLQAPTPTLSLTVNVGRGSERIRAWSLTYALLMVRIYTDACR